MEKIEVICNTSPIIGLVSINHLNLLCELFKTVYVPQAVYEELCAKSETHQSDIEQIKAYFEEGKYKLYNVNNQNMVKAMYGRLHYGELEVIVGAKEKGIKVAIMDDLAARKMANELLIDTIGLVGILCLAKQERLIDSVKNEMDILRENGYYIDNGIYKKVLEKVKEDDNSEVDYN
jgi:predicted nucleic acid-binding protein